MPGRWKPWRAPEPGLRWLMVFSLLLGIGLSAINTYIPLYAAQDLGLSEVAAGLLLAVFGLTGLAARLWWTGWALSPSSSSSAP